MDELVLSYYVLKYSMPRKGFSPKVRKNRYGSEISLTVEKLASILRSKLPNRRTPLLYRFLPLYYFIAFAFNVIILKLIFDNSFDI